MNKNIKFALNTLCAATLLAATTAQAATIVIQNRDPAGVGFNDPTPVAPVGGNPGTTLGQQRFNVYRAAADIWEQNLQSTVPIVVSAGWEALTCTASSAVLGSAGAWNVWSSDDVAIPLSVPSTWYPQALANKLAGFDIPTFLAIPDDGSGYGNVDIKTQFNVNLGNANCLSGTPFYLGLDGNAGTKVNFMATLLHELGHGLGFSVLTVNTANGSRFLGLPSIWEGFMTDNTTGKTWLQMTNAERTASTINFQKLAWSGPNAAAAAPIVLAPGVIPKVTITGPAAGPTTGDHVIGTASFGQVIAQTPLVGELMPVVALTTGGTPALTGPGCGPLSAADKLAVQGRFALIDRGVCGFAVKVKNAQLAGATGVLIADNVTAAVTGLGGTDPTITIPAARISKADGDALKVQLAKRSRTASGVFATLVAPFSGLLAGADAQNRPLLYTPNPRIAGSSVSHWDISTTPNQLMEPNISADLTTVLKPPKDLTVPLLLDLGWTTSP